MLLLATCQLKRPPLHWQNQALIPPMEREAATLINHTRTTPRIAAPRSPWDGGTSVVPSGDAVLLRLMRHLEESGPVLSWWRRWSSTSIKAIGRNHCEPMKCYRFNNLTFSTEPSGFLGGSELCQAFKSSICRARFRISVCGKWTLTLDNQ